MYLGFVVLFLVFCIFKLIGFVNAIHSEDPVTLCLSSLWMAQCNITLYIVVFNLDKKNDGSVTGEEGKLDLLYSGLRFLQTCGAKSRPATPLERLSSLVLDPYRNVLEDDRK